jgi:hypothetical protein
LCRGHFAKIRACIVGFCCLRPLGVDLKAAIPLDEGRKIKVLVKSTAAALDCFGEALGAIGAVKILTEAEQENDKKAGK